MQMRVQQDDSLSEGSETKTSVSEDNQSTPASLAGVRSVNIPQIYRQDVVRSRKRGMCGIATEVPGDSDSDSSITDDEEEDDHDEDDDDDEEVDDDGDNEDGNDSDKNKSNKGLNKNGGSSSKNGPLLDHQVQVLWMDGSESTENMSDVEVVDRGFLHGDYVAAASDPTGQVGVVIDVNLTCDLLAPNEAIVKDISSKDLKRVRDFAVGDYVVLGPWLGRIDDVVDNVTVLFDDGSVCQVTKADPLHLKPISKNLLEDGHFTYYPGQRVKASSSSVFKYSSWLSGLWKPNRLEGTVTKVTVGSVFVYWIASAGHGPDSSTAPAEGQSPKNLKLLSCFAHANWQLGDWCLLPASVRSSSISLDIGLSKLELHDSINSELDPSQTGSGFDSEEVTLEGLNGKEDAMDADSADGSQGNGRENKASHESSSSGSPQSVSRDPHRDTWPLHRKKIRKVVIRRDKKVRKKVENFEKALMIVHTKTRVDVAWQDGTIEHGVGATTLIPIDNPGDHEFVAEQYVVEKTADDNETTCESRRVGVVKSVCAKDRTACVRWLKQVSRAEDPREFDNEEIVSVYELESHPDYDYCYGDVVVRLCPVPLSSRTFSGWESEHPKMQSGPRDLKKGSTKAEDESGNDAYMDFSELSWVGNITGLKNGDIEVTWADGMVSTVGPQAIYVVGRDDDGDSVPAGSEISDDVSWETVDDDGERNVLEDSKEEIRLNHPINKTPEAEDNMESNSGKNAALSMPLAAIRFVTRLASGIFSRGQKNFDPLCLHSKGEFDNQSDGLETSDGKATSEEYHSQTSSILDTGDKQHASGIFSRGQNDFDPLCLHSKGEIDIQSSGLETSNGKATSEEYHSQTSSILDTGDKQQDDGKMEDHVASHISALEAAEVLCNLRSEEGNGSVCEEDETCNFKRFDIAKDPSDHYFVGASAQNNNSRRWLKKVQQDWNILHNNLPEGIYVRVYEDRMDLIRAVIVGAYGTPYQDGLFFFDFHLPPEYPDAPPSAYYHSGGWRVNPNLYEEGKVCLSLLNTWTGRGNEVWDPKSSSILQVLVSLQGLVLNAKPYFNEAGYDKQIGTAEGEKNSLSYNENTYLLNCKAMMYLMRKPPKEFEPLIKEHFKRRGYYILKACDAYMKGYLIGSLSKDASVNCKGDQDSNSVGFKLMLGKLMPKLFLALSEVGADCQEFQHLQQS